MEKHSEIDAELRIDYDSMCNKIAKELTTGNTFIKHYWIGKKNSCTDILLSILICTRVIGHQNDVFVATHLIIQFNISNFELFIIWFKSVFGFRSFETNENF